MSLSKCIQELLDKKQITKAQAKTIAAEAEKLKNQGVDPAKADVDAIAGLKSKLKRERYKTALEIKAMESSRAEMNKFRGGDKTGGLKALLRWDVGGRAPGVQDVHSISRAIYGRATHKLYNFLETFRSKIPGGFDIGIRGRQDKLAEFALARHGRKVADADIQRMSDIYQETLDDLIDTARRSGLDINKLDDWGLPHRWDAGKLTAAGKENYTREMLSRIDKSRMRDHETGRQLNDQEIKKLVEEAYDTITTDGANKKVRMGGALSRKGPFIQTKRMAQRVFHFTPEGWLELHKQFGTGDIFETAIKSLEDLSSDIAIAQKFGPKPDKVFRQLAAEAELQRKQAGKGSGLVAPELMWEVATGRTQGIANPKFADVAATLGNIQVASKLGSAQLAAFADAGFAAQQAKLLNLSMTNILKNYGSLFKGNQESRQLAIQMGLSADAMTGVLSTASRYAEMDVVGKASKYSAQAADFVLRASGLVRHTEAAKLGFGMELNTGLAAKIKSGMKTLEDLPESLRIELQDVHGFSGSDWKSVVDSVRTKESGKYKGAHFIDIDALPQDVQTKFLAMVHAETRLAVPEPDLELQAFRTQGQAAGSYGRVGLTELTRFLSFPITVLLDNVRRFMYHPSYLAARNKYMDAAKLVTNATLIGGVVLQAKAISDGKDPMDMSTPDFWARAVLQGGALGWFGDVLLGDPSFYNEAISAGPVIGMVNQAVSIVGNARKALAGEETSVAKDTEKFFRQNTPGTNLWYTKLLMRRYIWDQLRLMADPKAHKAMKRAETRMKNETGQQYFWRPGRFKPDRGPRGATAPKK